VAPVGAGPTPQDVVGSDCGPGGRLAILLADAIIEAPGLLPGTQCGGALGLDVAPPPPQHLLPHTAPALHPGTLGHSAQHRRRQVEE